MRDEIVYRDSPAFEMLEDYYVSRVEIARILNVSASWIDKHFEQQAERIKVIVIAHYTDENGEEKEGVQNRYIYYRREHINYFLSRSYVYKYIQTPDGINRWVNEPFGAMIDIDDFTKVIPAFEKGRKGGIREKTAVENNYLMFRIGQKKFYYPRSK